MLTITFYYTPIILHAALNKNGVFENEWFFIFDDGVIGLDGEKKTITLMERDFTNTSKLIIPLQGINSIDCRPFKSRHGHYEGGHICFEGFFDRGIYEKITLKTDRPTFFALLEALKTATSSEWDEPKTNKTAKVGHAGVKMQM